MILENERGISDKAGGFIPKCGNCGKWSGCKRRNDRDNIGCDDHEKSIRQ